jgi:hypothetical protein
MVEWRLQLNGALALYKGGAPFRLRTHQQALLLARLAAHSHGIDRGETALLLWPEAGRANALAYLRRATMELRRVGLPVEADRERLWLDETLISTDLDVADQARVLKDIEHPIAHEIRGMVIRRSYGSQQAKPADQSTIVRSQSEAILAVIAETLIREHPEVALDLLNRHGLDLVLTSSLEPLLDILLRALAASDRLTVNRVGVTRLAGWVAILLTRYSLAERLLTQAEEGCRVLKEDGLRARLLGMLAFLNMERRDWPAALRLALRAIEAADVSDDADAIAAVHNNAAGIQWHLLQFDEAAKNYAIAYDAATVWGQRHSVLGNATLIWGLYGVPVHKTFEPTDFRDTAVGAAVGSEGIGQVGYGIGTGNAYYAALGCRRLLKHGGQGLERYFCVALDLAAVTFARFGHPYEAAACVRICSRYRYRVGHARSPAEKLSIRRHVRTPLFGKEVAAIVEEIDSSDAAICAARVVRRIDARFGPALDSGT